MRRGRLIVIRPEADLPEARLCVLRVESEVIEIKPSRSRPDRGMVTVRSETRNQREDIVQILVAMLIVPRRPTVDEDDKGIP